MNPRAKWNKRLKEKIRFPTTNQNRSCCLEHMRSPRDRGVLGSKPLTEFIFNKSRLCLVHSLMYLSYVLYMEVITHIRSGLNNTFRSFRLRWQYG